MRPTLRPIPRLHRRTAALSLLSRVIAGSAILAFLVAVAFTILLVATSDLRRSTSEQARLRGATEATLGLERVVNELETGLRSFAIGNADQQLLDSWRQGRAELPAAIAAVEQADAGEPSQSLQVRQLAGLIHSYISEYGVQLIRIAQISPEAARSPVATQEGLLRIGSIRGRLSQLLAEEEARAAASATSAKVEATQAVRVGVAALAATGGLLTLFGIFLARGIARPVRTVAAGASQVASGDLSTRLAEGGAAEINTLTQAFNAMARSLEGGKRELETQNHELRESQRQMAQLVSIVSHELRTPLACILGYTSVLLTRDVEHADATHYLEIIHEQGKRLQSLFDEFLDGESVNAGQIELKDELIDLRPLLLTEAHVHAEDAVDHRVENDLGTDALTVRGDRDRIAQVFSNLLANAIKYSPDGGIIEVRAGIEGDAVRVQVSDEGIGIPEEHQARIFTKFFRGEARRSGIAGTGLGLAFSREIVEAHGGRIGFTSRQGAGSTFWFELPLRAEPAEHPATAVEPRTAPARSRPWTTA
jgi:signal transduction histidine kinase